MQTYPQIQSYVGSIGQTLRTNVSMTLWGSPCTARTLRAHCTRTARYFLDQVALEESPSTPLPNAVMSPLP